MVATVMRQSLVKYDIFNNNKLRGNKAFKKSNIKQDNLRKLILTVATEWNIPHGIPNTKKSKKKKKSKTTKTETATTTNDNESKASSSPFIIKPSGSEDYGIFEFGNLRKATKPLIFKNNQIICCVGDSVYAPFWPKGTGVKLS